MNQYYNMQDIGAGSFGQVFRAQKVVDNSNVAIKIFKRDDTLGHDIVQSTSLREITSLQKCKNKYIAEVLDIIYDFSKGQLAIVFPLYEMHLHEYIKLTHKSNSMNIDIARKLFFQLLSGLNFIHTSGVIHRDLKPINILIDKNQDAKIGDFGLSRNFYNASRLDFKLDYITQDVITLNYKSPEIMLGSDSYDFSVDIWSLGCIFYFIATGETLFNGDTEIGMLFKQFNFTGVPSNLIAPTLVKLKNFKQSIFPKFVPKSMITNLKVTKIIGLEGACLIDDMLRLEPSTRPSCQSALSHPFFN